MQLTRISILIVLAFCIFACGAATGAEDGTLEITVIGPDGQSVINRAVRVFWKKKPFGEDYYPTSAKRKTDAEGMFSVSLDSRVHRVTVVVKGIGFCSTGNIEIAPGRTSKVTTPRLARFATVEGRCDPKLLKPESKVWLRTESWNSAEAQFDKNGNFVLRGLTPGACSLAASGKVPLESVFLRLVPGQRLRGVVFRAKVTKVSKGVFRRHRTPPGVLKGQVTDARGKPIAGASVFAVNEYHGGLRMYRKVSRARTGKDGKYTIPDIRSGTGITVAAAFVKGRPLALRSVPYSGTWSAMFGMGGMRSVPTGPGAVKAGLPPVFRADLIVAPRGGGLDVKVLADGKPVPNALVRLEPGDWYPFFSQGWARNHGGAAPKAFFDVLRPTRKAGADGVAKFDDLPPGGYIVHAIREGKPEDLAAIAGWGIDIRPKAYLGKAEHVTVTVAKRRGLSLKVYRRVIGTKLRILDLAGNPLRKVGIGYSWESSVIGGYRSSGTNLDEKGIMSFCVDRHGLWTFESRFREAPIKSVPVRTEPYCRGRIRLAVSRLLDRPGPVDVRATRMEPGKVRIQLLGLDGKPVRGAVFNDSGIRNSPAYAASTDENGAVTFPNMATMSYRLYAAPADPVTPVIIMKTTLKDAVLRRQIMFPSVEARTEANKTVKIIMRLQKAGFVRGKLKLKTPIDLSKYSVQHSAHRGGFMVPTHVDLDRKTGEFLCGPVVPGKLTLWLWYHPGGNRHNVCVATRKIDVKPGAVERVELAPLPKKQHKPVGLMVNWSPVRGKVLMADGKTPAYGARVQKFVPGTDSPVSGAVTGADGTFLTTGLSIWSSARGRITGPKLTVPVVVAWLPGRCGPTVLPTEPRQKGLVKIVLPPPVGVTGKVTVGGKSAAGLKATIRVVAVDDSKKALPWVYAIKATPDADGQFRLDGLVPGKYRVQASLDNIWVSKTIVLNVTKAGAKGIELDILALGEPIEVKVLGEDGKPLPNEEVKPVLPSGPLTDIIHHGNLTSDAEGKVRLEGLPAGKHLLKIVRTGRTQEITIPALR